MTYVRHKVTADRIQLLAIRDIVSHNHGILASQHHDMQLNRLRVFAVMDYKRLIEIASREVIDEILRIVGFVDRLPAVLHRVEPQLILSRLIAPVNPPVALHQRDAVRE